MESQLRNLADRCANLAVERDNAMSRAAKSEMELVVVRRNLANESQFRSADLMRLTEAKAEILRLEAMMEGYRLHAKDVAAPARIPDRITGVIR